MDDGLKQRLVGALVIVAAAIIFIPMIFNETDPQSEDIKVDIPSRPKSPEPILVKPQRPAVVKAVIENKIKKEVESPVTQKQEEKAVLPTAWVLQLASFKERQNADALRDKLRSAGHKSYVTYRKAKDDGMARVFVGPELDRKKIEQLKSTLKNDFKLEGFVLRYLPE